MDMWRYGSSLWTFNSLHSLVRYWVEYLKREIPYLRGTMYYFVYYINSLLTRRSQLNSCRKSRAHCHSFMALNRISELSAADWLSQTGVKHSRNFSQIKTLVVMFAGIKMIFGQTQICFSPTAKWIYYHFRGRNPQTWLAKTISLFWS